MPTKEVTLQYINTGIGKTGKPFWNFKSADGETFWSNGGHPVPGASEGLTTSVDYTVNRNGGFQIVKLGAGETKSNGMKPAPGKPEGPTRANTSRQEHENMLVRGGVCAAITAQAINPKDPSDVEEVITALKEGLRRSTNPQHDADMNDEIPI